MNISRARAVFAAGAAFFAALSLGHAIYWSRALHRPTPHDLGDLPPVPSTAAETTATATATARGLAANEDEGANSAAIEDDPACRQLAKNDSMSDYEFYTAVHESPFPACAAGTWTHRPDLVVRPSAAHLACLDEEAQGNCHDPNSWRNASEKSPKWSRRNHILHNMVANSPGILNASDPWVWRSDLEAYEAIPFDGRNQDEYRERVRKILLHPGGGKRRTVYLVGDSLTRQWHRSMICELAHVLGVPVETAEDAVRMLQMHTGFTRHAITDNGDPFVREATERDYVVFNFGHHVGKKLGDLWQRRYHTILREALTWDFGRIPDDHVLFRTTSVRHFRRGAGDWNTDRSEAGATAPNMRDAWSNYGGNSPEQPLQNLVAFYELLGPGNEKDGRRRRGFRILDTSPMTLARADASFDGCHFCLPGPMDVWSRMLYRRIERDDEGIESSSSGGRRRGNDGASP